MVNGTIPHEVAVNFKSSSLFLHPAHPGTGIIAGGSVRKVFAVSGIKDIIAKQHGASNGITNARVTMKALQSLKPLNLVREFGKTQAVVPVSKAEAPVVVKKETAPALVEKKKEVAPVKATPAKKTATAEKAPAKKAPAKKKAE